MRILLTGPTGGQGSLPPYLDELARALRQYGATVDRLGTPGVPCNPRTGQFWTAGRIMESAERLLAGVDLASYDLLSVHYGNLETEQLLPSLWKRQARRPAAVYHAHSLDWTLFTAHVPDPVLRSAVDDAIGTMDGFVFFGSYGQSRLSRQYQIDVPSTIAWLPTTIPPGTRASAGPALRAALSGGYGPVGSLYGYAAPWKDLAGLISACGDVATACRILLAGPFWDDPDQAGTDLSRETAGGARHGAARVDVLAAYLGPGEREALARGSDFAVFPYRHHPAFQGSGAIADYLARAVPVIATDVANMAELTGDAGLIVRPGDKEAFASGMDRLAADENYRNALSRNARRRSGEFTAARHAARCLRLYETAIARKSART